LLARDGQLSKPIVGLPPVRAAGQGGLLDVALDRDFAQNRTLYFCFAHPVPNGGQTALARARLGDDDLSRLTDVRVIFRQDGPPSSGNHYGCRIAQARDGALFLTTGDHFVHRDEAQDLSNHLGKIVRLNPDGSVPPDNPRTPSPKSGAMGTAIPKARPFTPRPASCGCTNMARAAATR
jgi:glucose/arabinose dehydrogenase